MITERKRTEEQLQIEVAEREKAERELESQIAFVDVLLDAAEDTIEIFDPDDMRYLKWNKKANELSGRSDEEIAVMDPVRDFIAEEDIPATLAAVEQALVEGRTKVRCTVVSKDGTRTPMEYTGSVPRDADGNPLQFIAIGRDISEQIRIEDALRQSEEMYRDLVEKISDVIYAINREGVITYLSPAAESLLGLPPEQLVGRPFAQSIYPEDLEQVQENVQALLAGEVPGTAEYRVLNALGEIRWIRVTSQPIVDEGQVTGFRGVLTDITERKRVEEQLEEAAITAERQRLARDLHDSVTQTLYSLDLFANAAQEALSKGKIETGTEHAQRIRSLSQSALVDMRLLIFELQPPLLEQEGLAGALRARLESVEVRAGLTTEFEAMLERPLSPLVESELYAVAREALNNALRHAQADRIIVKLDCDERGCCLTIRDDGVGFDLATIERTGGFGLRNMADRAERMGGSLTLETAPGKGTTVRVEVAA